MGEKQKCHWVRMSKLTLLVQWALLIGYMSRQKTAKIETSQEKKLLGFESLLAILFSLIKEFEFSVNTF